MEGHKAGKREIELFSGYYLSTAEACALIRAYSGADVIREWQGIGAGPAAREASVPSEAAESGSTDTPVWYAGVRARSGGPAQGPGKTVLGEGRTAERAIADLIWRLVGPRLLADETL